MKKIIVVRLENVLVNGYDVENVFYGKMKKMVGEKYEEFLKKDVVKGGEKKKEWVREWKKGFEGVEEMLDVVKSGFEGRGENVYEVEKMRRRMEEMEKSKIERMEGLRREYFEKSFEKKELGGFEKREFEDLGKLRDWMKDLRVIVVSEIGKRKVSNLLRKNGFDWMEVVGDCGNVFEVVEGMEKEKVIVFSKKEKEIESCREKGFVCEESMKGGLMEKIGVKRLNSEDKKVEKVEKKEDDGSNSCESFNDSGKEKKEMNEENNVMVKEKKGFDDVVEKIRKAGVEVSEGKNHDLLSVDNIPESSPDNNPEAA